MKPGVISMYVNVSEIDQFNLMTLHNIFALYLKMERCPVKSRTIILVTLTGERVYYGVASITDYIMKW